MNDTIQYTVDNDGIATLKIDIPGRSMNVLFAGLISDLSECVDRVAADENVKGAILTSGKAAFVAGADLSEIVTAFDRGITPLEGYQMSSEFTGVLRKMETLKSPTAQQD